MLNKQMGELLIMRGWRIAVAESATGGLLGHWLTSVSGSSRYFWGGAIAYANEAKTGLLNVQAETLRRWGAVSPQVAAEMARGVVQALNIEMGVSITGIAGPTGATITKPVGLYFIGVAFFDDVWVWRHEVHGERQSNNEAIAHAAMQHVVDCLR